MPSTALHEIPLQGLNGERRSLSEFRDRVLLIVNVASQCGLTPQYTGLQQLHETYQSAGLSVLGFPCNDFAAQEPGSEAQIQAFCETSYGVTFPLFAKININSTPRHPLYAALIAAQPEAQGEGTALAQTLAKHNLLPKHASDVLWNFEKFLVGRDGTVVGRFAPDVAPQSPLLTTAIKTALA